MVLFLSPSASLTFHGVFPFPVEENTGPFAAEDNTGGREGNSTTGCREERDSFFSPVMYPLISTGADESLENSENDNGNDNDGRKLRAD